MEPRERMLREIEAEARHTGDRTGRPRLSPGVMEAMGRVPREKLVPEGMAARAYDNSPLPIGEGQTISQPFIVALMTDFLDPGPDARILEVGTGCGYQAAVLAELVAEVFTVENLPGLGDAAAERLKRLGYGNVRVRIGDGSRGWPEEAPFDGIIVTAAARELPQALVDQLAPGGRMVIPVGRSVMGQELRLVTRDAEGEVDSRTLLPVSFVPLEGG